MSRFKMGAGDEAAVVLGLALFRLVRLVCSSQEGGGNGMRPLIV